MQYRITSESGLDLGTYDGDNAGAAFRAMLDAAGYESAEAMAEALGHTVETLRAELRFDVVPTDG